jgi:ABC-type lipopolysaccharide export system ATPase subunit
MNADETEIERKVRESLGFVGLEEAIDKYPSELSGGMKRRVALARALISEPDIMLYDEPTAGLDPITSKRINELIIALRGHPKVSLGCLLPTACAMRSLWQPNTQPMVTSASVFALKTIFSASQTRRFMMLRGRENRF